jgi:formylglycine-generating enzyme required for sulfatase activity
MFGKAIVRGALAAVALAAAGAAMGDTFGDGTNQFTIDFVGISGATNPTDTTISGGYGIVAHDFRMGAFEITNDQWNKFKAAYGTVTGSQGGYGHSSVYTGANVPAECINWYGAAQFVNWLNTSTGNPAAYKFTGTRGTSDYTFVPWSTTDAGYDAANPYRNKNAKYVLPTEHEWVKAAYWNGTELQTYATKPGESFTQGNGTSHSGWNFYHDGFATTPMGPWPVGSGSLELNGTYDMMGNDYEWVESPWAAGDYGAGSWHTLRGGEWDSPGCMTVSDRDTYYPPEFEGIGLGFRVASVPEPSSLLLLVSGAVAAWLWWRRRG